jgi:hypothetical protein
MSTSIQPQSTSRAESLIHRITADCPAAIPREQLIADLPEILFAALELLLEDVTCEPGDTHPSAIACRILATAVERLR